MTSERPEERPTLQEQIDALDERVGANRESITALEAGAATSLARADTQEARADKNHLRIEELETRVDLDHELILELQAEGLISQQQAANLEKALITSRVIGAAVGIIMARLGATQEQAFIMLRTASQHRNRKLRELAEDVVLTGSVSDLPSK